MPPRDLAFPSPPGQGPRQGSGAAVAQHAGGPGYVAPGGYRPGPGYAGSGGPAEASERFDGGYAKVIRASDRPIRSSGPARPSGHARPSGFGATGDPARPSGRGRLWDPARPAAPPADVYVYRDTDLPGDSGPPAAGPDEDDPAYWYDLPVTGPAGSAGPAGSDQPGGIPHVLSETRGPFEPLVSSADPPGISANTGASAQAGAGGAGNAGPARDAAHPPEADPARDSQEGQEDPSHARKLEQIKELYLTAEAIGEANVDKHFDQLMAQQRELISDYFKRPGAAGPAAAPLASAPPAPAGLAENEPRGTRPPGGPAGPPEGAHVAADQPRAW